MKMKRTLLASAMGVALAAAGMGTAGAIPVTFDPTGLSSSGAPSANAQLVDVLDWAPDSALAVNAVPVTPGATFTLLAHARLSVASLNGLPVFAPGINAPEITFVASLQERVKTVTFNPSGDPVSVVFETLPGGFFEIWVNDGPGVPVAGMPADPLTGIGYNDGELALRGVITGGSTSSFTNDTFNDPTGKPPVALDQYNGDDWGGQLTDQGTGGGKLRATVSLKTGDPNIFINPKFFPLADTIPQEFTFTLFDTQLNLPFTKVDPSMCFDTAMNGDPAGSCAAGNGYVPNLGAINGENGPDFIMMTDSSTSFAPEPGSIALLGAGLLGLGFGARRMASKRGAA